MPLRRTRDARTATLWLLWRSFFLRGVLIVVLLMLVVLMMLVVLVLLVVMDLAVGAAMASRSPLSSSPSLRRNSQSATGVLPLLMYRLFRLSCMECWSCLLCSRWSPPPPPLSQDKWSCRHRRRERASACLGWRCTCLIWQVSPPDKYNVCKRSRVFCCCRVYRESRVVHETRVEA